MNYLDLVNGVLRRLREDTVTSLFENELSSLVSELVNDAKRQVENSHDWSNLRGDIRVATSDGIQRYSLLGTGNRATVKDVRNVTSKSLLTPVPSFYMRRQSIVNSVGNSKPTYWALQGVDSSGDTQVDLWPIPDGIYNIDFYCVQRTDDLQAEGSQLTIPHQPVVLLATAMAAQDRGDVDGPSLQSLFAKAQTAMAEHIMLDAAKNPDEMIWMHDGYSNYR